jgi:hypothetical protein
MDTPPIWDDGGRMQTLNQTDHLSDQPSHHSSDQRDGADDPRQATRVVRAIERRAFGILSTVSPAGHPHAAGVVYDAVTDEAGLRLYVNTLRSSRKALNVQAHQRAAFVIPVRRLPVAPPFTIQFQAAARIVAMDDPEITDLVRRGALGHSAAHGALDEPDGCFIRIDPVARIHTYGIGVSTIAVARDPLHVGARTVVIRR